MSRKRDPRQLTPAHLCNRIEAILSGLVAMHHELKVLVTLLPRGPGLMPGAWLPLLDAADALGVSERTMRRWIGDGHLATRRVGRRVEIASDSIERYLNRTALADKPRK